MDTSTTVVNVSVKNLRPHYNNIHHWLQNGNHIYIGRRIHYVGVGDSIWGNPFSVTKYGREKCIALYKKHVRANLMDQVPTLKGKILGCWCKPQACHGDALVELINESILLEYSEKHPIIRIVWEGGATSVDDFTALLEDTSFPINLYPTLADLLTKHRKEDLIHLSEALLDSPAPGALPLAECLIERIV